MKNSVKLFLLVTICCFFNVFPVDAVNSKELQKLGLVDLQVENNFFGLEDLNSQKTLEAAIQNNSYLPEEIMVTGIGAVRIPIIQGRYGLGFVLDGGGWGKIDNDLVKFYRDSKKPVTGAGKYYRLDGEYELYTTYGLYQSLTLPIGPANLVILGKLFNCSEYMHFKTNGQVFVEPSGNNQPSITVDGNYQREQMAAGSTGWGAGLGCELKLGSVDSWNIALVIDNLPGMVYLSKFQQETGKTDTDHILSPLNLSGIATESAAWVSLPLKLSGELNLPVWIGKIQLAGMMYGDLGEYSIGYLCPVYKELMLGGSYNPIMENLKVGLNWGESELSLYYGVESQQLTGLSLNFKF